MMCSEFFIANNEPLLCAFNSNSIDSNIEILLLGNDLIKDHPNVELYSVFPSLQYTLDSY